MGEVKKGCAECAASRRLVALRDRQRETSTRGWVAAAERALAGISDASNSTHPAYSLWLRVEMSKQPPMGVVLSEGVATTSASDGEVRDGEAAERPNPNNPATPQQRGRG